VDPRSPGIDLNEINRKLAGRLVLVRLADGTQVPARDVSVSESAVTFRREMLPHFGSPWPARDREALPWPDVRAIEVNRRGIGALQGALAGLGIGAVVGAGAGGAVFGPDDDISRFIGAVSFGVVGGLLGLLVGQSVGSAAVYELSPASSVE
jgi:hypothetical protein